MASRYLVTGVQLGMLSALPEKNDREQLTKKIIDDQYICSSEVTIEEDVSSFKKLIISDDNS